MDNLLVKILTSYSVKKYSFRQVLFILQSHLSFEPSNHITFQIPITIYLSGSSININENLRIFLDLRVATYIVTTYICRILKKNKSMINMWNERYAQDEYIYGIEPNMFFKEQLDKLKAGKILLPAEGEGRNANYAAQCGWDVIAFDNSIEAKKKAEKLAKTNQQKIDYRISSLEEFNEAEGSFDVIALVYVHTPKRHESHKNILRFLKPGGTLILEGFAKNQLTYNTGGPRKLELLFSKEELLKDFESLNNIDIKELDIVLNEGEYHKGKASVIRLIAKK